MEERKAKMKTQLTEEQMRLLVAPTPNNLNDLSAFIEEVVGQDHEYGTCVYAMSLAAVAAYNYVASRLGVTGFQASCADLDILRRTRNIEGPFMLLDLNDCLYPNRDYAARLDEFIGKNELWLRLQARKKLAESRGNKVNPQVMAHWIFLAFRLLHNVDEIQKWKEHFMDEDPFRGKDEIKEKAFWEGVCGFIANDFTEKFVESRAADFKRFGFSKVWLHGEGDAAKAEKAEDAGCHRCNFPISIKFSRTIDGLEVNWFYDTEPYGANGSPGLKIDFFALHKMAEFATGPVKDYLADYIARAIKASAKDASLPALTTPSEA